MSGTADLDRGLPCLSGGKDLVIFALYSSRLSAELFLYVALMCTVNKGLKSDIIIRIKDDFPSISIS